MIKNVAFLLARLNSCLNVWKMEWVSRIVCNVTRWIFRPIFYQLGTRLTISDRCTANTSLVASHTSARRCLQYQCRESPGIQGVYLGSGFRHWYSNRTGFSSWEMTLWLPKLTLISQLLYSLWSWLLPHSFIYVFFLGLCHSTTHSTKCLGTSLNMISFTRPPPALVLQATNAGVEGLGIKTIDGFHSIFSLGNWRALHTMLTADWSISKSHDLFAFQFLWWRCYGTHL